MAKLLAVYLTKLHCTPHVAGQNQDKGICTLLLFAAMLACFPLSLCHFARIVTPVYDTEEESIFLVNHTIILPQYATTSISSLQLPRPAGALVPAPLYLREDAREAGAHVVVLVHQRVLDADKVPMLRQLTQHRIHILVLQAPK